jgi:hypothetical protein
MPRIEIDLPQVVSDTLCDAAAAAGIPPAELLADALRGLTVADDAAREKMEGQLLDLEHQEEAFIRQAAAEGKSIPRRADANPVVLLAD